MKGASVAAEVAAARSVIVRLGGADPVISTYGEGVLEEATRAVLIERTSRFGPTEPSRSKGSR